MTPTPKLSLGLLLTASAGFIDAVGFIELGGFFVSFVSGNTTQLGQALAVGLAPVAELTASLITLFFIGSFAGASLALLPLRWAPSAVLVLVLLAMIASLMLSVGGFTSTQAMLALAVAAGAQNAILPSHGAVRLGTTFVTGTMFGAAQDLAKALRRQAPPWRWLQHLLVWCSLLAGAALGALGHRTFGTYALAGPFAVYLAFLVAFSLLGPRNVQA
jgi:uncharacterized membrane protein YoaK (UPF0700 family)